MSADKQSTTIVEASKDLATVLALLGAAILFSQHGNDTLAATALGGCLSYVVPKSSRVPPVAIGLVCGVIAGGLSA